MRIFAPPVKVNTTCADHWGMPITAYDVVEATNHFPIINGWVYRDCWVRLTDGSVALYSLPDHKLGAL